MFDVNEFEKMPVEACMDRFDWGHEGKPGTVAYHGFAGGFEVFADEMAEGVNGAANVFACEVYDADGTMRGEGYGETFEGAILAAFVMVTGPEALDEGNAEDAVNACAFGAFEAIHGRMPEHDGDIEEMDALLVLAVEYVRVHAEEAGIEWEDAWA